MAMGGSHHKGNSRSSGKPYGLMLLLAFGAALLGVMVLHKLRERRIFSLLVKEKDSQLISLQLLFQKEMEYGKEMKRKNEEMKSKLYSLRTQRMELDRRLLEMQSSIDSLKDEHKAIESALEEKQNEIKMQIDASKENSQLIDLKQILNQKESEIEDLRHRLEHPVKVWSVSKDKSDTSSIKEAGGELHESANFVDDRIEKSTGDTNIREITVEHLEKPENSQDEGVKNGGKGIDVSEGERKNNANSREKVVDDQGTVLKPRDNSSDVKDGIEHTITRERELEKLENSHEDEKQEGGMKLEMLDSRTRSRGKHGHMNRTKGKRWMTLAKNRVSENNGVASVRSRRFYRLDQDELRRRSAGQASNEGIGKGQGKETGENPQEVRKTVDTQMPKANPANDEHLENIDENADPNQQLQQENENRQVHMDRRVNDEKLVSNELVKQPEEEEEASGIQQKLISSRDNYEQENMAKQVKDSDKLQLTGDIEAADVQESVTEATNGGSMEESASKSNLEEDKEEYNEETGESEF